MTKLVLSSVSHCANKRKLKGTHKNFNISTLPKYGGKIYIYNEMVIFCNELCSSTDPHFISFHDFDIISLISRSCYIAYLKNVLKNYVN